MPKFLICGDIHQNATGPGARKDSWPDEINAKLTFISELAEKNACSGILQLGDCWNLKVPARTPHWLIQSTHAAMTAADVDWHFVAGNHDESNDRYDSIDRQPLGTLSKMRNMYLVYKQSEHFPEVYGIPYLQDWSTLPAWIDEYNEHREKHPEIERGIIITHASLFPRKDEPIYDFIADEDLAGMLKYPTTVMHGHLHFSQGSRVYGDVEIINYGAISRGSLHKETINRQPQVYIYNTATGKHKTYNIPVKPPEEVFALEPHELEKERTEKLTEFLSGLDTDSTGMVTSVEQMVEHVTTTQDVSSDVKVLVSELLDFAQEK